MVGKKYGKDGARRRIPGVAYKCTKCDKFGHNAIILDFLPNMDAPIYR